MKTAIRRFVAAAHAFALSSALSACMLVGGDTLVVPGGAEDFPNTVTPLGRIAVTDFVMSGGWEQAPVITPEMPELPSLDSLQLSPPNGKIAATGKTAARGAFAKTSAIDTLNMALWRVDSTRLFEAYFLGRIYAYAYDSSASTIRRDTVTTLYLGDRSKLTLGSIGEVIDSINANPAKNLRIIDFRGAVRQVATGVRQSYRLRDINAEGELDIAEYVTLTPLEGGGTHRKWVKVYGLEGAYALPNAVPEEFELLRRGPAGDTLEWTLVKDADWDRKLWTSEASGIVDLYFRVRNPESKPDVLRMHSYLRGAYKQNPGGVDSLKQLIYQEQRWLRNGRNVTFIFQGLGTEDNLLLGNDTALMTIDTVFALRDSLIKYSAVYKMLLGPVPDRMQDHKMVAYSVSKNWRAGELFSNVALFFPTAPVPMGQSGFTGLMSTTAAYRNGDTTTTEGSIDSTGFNLQMKSVKDGLSETYDVVLDAAGKLIRVTPAAPADATASARRAAPALRKP